MEAHQSSAKSTNHIDSDRSVLAIKFIINSENTLRRVMLYLDPVVQRHFSLYLDPMVQRHMSLWGVLLSWTGVGNHQTQRSLNPTQPLSHLLPL